jgi:hypothetical protein
MAPGGAPLPGAFSFAGHVEERRSRAESRAPIPHGSSAAPCSGQPWKPCRRLTARSRCGSWQTPCSRPMASGTPRRSSCGRPDDSVWSAERKLYRPPITGTAERRVNNSLTDPSHDRHTRGSGCSRHQRHVDQRPPLAHLAWSTKCPPFKLNLYSLGQPNEYASFLFSWVRHSVFIVCHRDELSCEESPP